MNTVYRGTSRQAARKASAAIAALSEASSPPKRRRRMAPVAAGAGADHSSTTPTLPSVDQARKGRGRAALPPPPSPPSRPSIRVAKRFREDSDEDSDDYEEHSTLKSVAKHRAAKKTRQPPPKKQRAKPWPSSYLNTLTCFRPDWEPTLEYECPLCHDKGPLLNQSSPSGQPADLTVHFGGHLAQMRSKTKAEQEAEKEVQETSEEMTEDEQDNAGDTQKTQKQPGLSTSGVLVDCPWPDCAEKNIPGARFAVHVRIVHYGVRWRCPTNCGWLSEASDRVRGHCNREHATDPMLEGLL